MGSMVLAGVHEKFRGYLRVSCTQKHGWNRGYKIGVIVSGRASIRNERLPSMKMKARRCREPMDTVYMGNGRAHPLTPSRLPQAPVSVDSVVAWSLSLFWNAMQRGRE